MKTILLVEDDPAVRRGIKENLEREHFRVLVEQDGAKGLRRARKDTPDLIILDVMLPGLNGFDICARLKKEGCPAPVFMLTGLADERARLRGLETGADQYIPKPFSLEELLLRVKNSFEQTDRMLGKARSLERELLKAREIQKNALPSRAPKVPGLDIFGTMIPATHVGGDYFDYLPIGYGLFGTVVADVSGKGMPAALYVHKMQGIVQSTRASVRHASDLLGHLQEFLGTSMEASSFVTAAAAVFDIQGRTVDIASAGHPPVLLKSGNRLYEVDASGMIIGPAGATVFQDLVKPTTLNVRPGDVLMFYSDGVLEAMNTEQEEFGMDRLKNSFLHAEGSARAVAARCLRDVRNFIGDEPQSDDTTIVVVHINTGETA
jgi:sigma-B regulation protein RsbU (phosphoserine phosphatase)